MQKAKLAQFLQYRCPVHIFYIHWLQCILLSGCSNEVLLVQTIIAGRGWLGWCRLLGNLWTVASVKCLVRANVRTQDTQCTVGLSWDSLHTGNINSGVSSPFLSMRFSDFYWICPYFDSVLRWSPLAGCASNKTRPWIFTRATFPRVFAARDPIVHWSQLVTSHSVHWVTQFRILCLELLLLSPAGTYNSQPHKPLWVNINDFMLVKWACKCSMFIKDSPNSIKLWCSWMYQTDHHPL